MNAPCDGRPEWTSDYPSERAIAIRGCQECPRKATCKAEALERGEMWGVWGGEDLSRAKVRSNSPAATVCENQECGEPLVYSGTRRRFCDDTCRSRASYHRRQGKAA